MVGRSKVIIKEQNMTYKTGDYPEGHTDSTISELTVKEQEFIKEYIEFTRYRKQKRADIGTDESS